MSSKPDAPRRADFTFLHPLRVRWAETDPQGIVFNGNYFLYFDVALTEYWRAAGIDIVNDLSGGEAESFAVSAHADYYAPAVFDEMIDVGVRLERVGNSSMRFAVGIFRGEQPLTGGYMVYAWATRTEPRTPCAPPADLLEKLRGV